MLFHSFECFLLFPVVIILFYVLPYKYRWLLLLIASCTFYMYFIPVYIVMLAGTIINYIAGIQIEEAEDKKKPAFLVPGLVATIAVLACFKYYNFFIANINHALVFGIPVLKIVLPIGFSLHTFQAMSYTMEVHSGKQVAEGRWLKLWKLSMNGTKCYISNLILPLQ